MRNENDDQRSMSKGKINIFVHEWLLVSMSPLLSQYITILSGLFVTDKTKFLISQSFSNKTSTMVIN